VNEQRAPEAVSALADLERKRREHKLVFQDLVDAVIEVREELASLRRRVDWIENNGPWNETQSL
jgi:hypothetical protein